VGYDALCSVTSNVSNTAVGDSVLVAEYHNDRVQQVQIIEDEGSFFVRFVGDRVLNKPQCVDCNNHFIVVSAYYHRISVFLWATGDLISQFGSEGSGPGQLDYFYGVTLLKGREPGLVVADMCNHRLCVFKVNGEFVAALGSEEQGLRYPRDVLECKDGFIAANCRRNNLILLSRDGGMVEVYGKRGDGDGNFQWPSALAALPDGGLVVRDVVRFRVLHDVTFRMAWIAACVWVC
jgi:hypothetical protein